MRTLGLVLIVALVTLACFAYFGRKPYRHKRVPQADLHRYLEALLRRGFMGGFVVIEVPQRPLFIQFAKYFGRRGTVGLQFDFPRAPWSEDHYERLKEELAVKGFSLSITPASGSDVQEFVTVDLKDDVENAATLAGTVLQDVFGLSKEEPVTLYFQKVSPKDERIVGRTTAEV